MIIEPILYFSILFDVNSINYTFPIKLFDRRILYISNNKKQCICF